MAHTHGAECYREDGEVSAELEAQRWLINRARYAPEWEADRLGLKNSDPGGSPDFDVCEDQDGKNDFGDRPEAWAPWIVSKGPLALNQVLSRAAYTHCLDMADTGMVQHESPSDRYYPKYSRPWERHALEGYDNQIWGFMENIVFQGVGISTGYPAHAISPESAHEALFVDEGVDDRGHRMAILNESALELGLGFAQSQSQDAGLYWTREYATQDFGRRDNRWFFTDTLFYDANTNGLYDPGEGVGEVEIRLYDGSVEHPWYDLSSAGGSFAVPIDGVTSDRTITAVLVNPGEEHRAVSLPMGSTAMGSAVLAPGRPFTVGIFRQPDAPANVGFRQLTLPTTVWLQPVAGGVDVHFATLPGLAYLIAFKSDLAAAAWEFLDRVQATSAATVYRDAVGGRPGAGQSRFYVVTPVRD